MSHDAPLSDDAPAPAVAALTETDREELRAAMEALDHTSFATQLAGLVGRQVGALERFVPGALIDTVNGAAAKALGVALRAALTTLPQGQRAASRKLHLAAVAASGALGGALGLATLPLELPVSTTLILRSIADIARAEGEDLSRPEAGLACLEVFALSRDGQAAPHLSEGGYFATRALLAKSVSEAARFVVNRGLVDETAPALLRLLGQIASRFGVVVSQKAVAQGLPVLGAVTGAAVNAAFMEHYQRLARGHFTVRRLERLHGEDAVRAAYESLRAERVEAASTASPAQSPPAAIETTSAA